MIGLCGTTSAKLLFKTEDCTLSGRYHLPIYLIADAPGDLPVVRVGCSPLEVLTFTTERALERSGGPFF